MAHHPPPTVIGPDPWPHNDPMPWQLQFRRAMCARAFAAAKAVDEREASAFVDRWYKEAWEKEGWEWVVAREVTRRLEQRDLERAVQARMREVRRAARQQQATYIFCKPMSTGLNNTR